VIDRVRAAIEALKLDPAGTASCLGAAQSNVPYLERRDRWGPEAFDS
jgi:hypothetical protein